MMSVGGKNQETLRETLILHCPIDDRKPRGEARLLDSNVLAVLPSSIEGSLANFLAIATLQEASVSAQ